MVTKKITQNQQAWQKELRRVKQFIRRAEKRGYTFDENVIPDTPKRITKKKLLEIRGLNPNTLYAQAQFLNPETGETITGLEGRTYERKRSARKGQQTRQNKRQSIIKPSLPQESDNVLRHIEQMISEWEPMANWSAYFTEAKREDKTRLETILQSSITEKGRIETARSLQNTATNVIDLADRVMYSSDEDQVQLDLVEFATILKGRSLTPEEAIDLTELAEIQEE